MWLGRCLGSEVTSVLSDVGIENCREGSGVLSPLPPFLFFPKHLCDQHAEYWYGGDFRRVLPARFQQDLHRLNADYDEMAETIEQTIKWDQKVRTTALAQGTFRLIGVFGGQATKGAQGRAYLKPVVPVLKTDLMRFTITGA